MTLRCHDGSVLFDVIVMIDWSASSTPTTGTDSIWIARLDTGGMVTANPPTRRRAEAMLHELLHEAAGQRVLVGVDVPFGYPAGFAACLGGDGSDDGDGDDPDDGDGDDPGDGDVAVPADPGPPWRRVWSAIAAGLTDGADNRNDRFALAARLNAMVGDGPGPFWGCPASQASADLSTRKDHRFPVVGRGGPIEEYRLTERRCRDAGRRPLSVWQTAYTGSVGSQALTAIPVLERLLNDPVLGRRVEVWPFTTGTVADPTCARPDAIVLAEIWPSGFDLDLGRHPVRDAAQVIGTSEWLAAADTDGTLGALFAPRLSDAERTVVVTEEAWILGVC